MHLSLFILCFFFNDTATTEIYTLSLHDALPISAARAPASRRCRHGCRSTCCRDRKSTRLNSSHGSISYAVFCLKKKKTLYVFHFVLQTPNHSDFLISCPLR